MTDQEKLTALLKEFGVGFKEADGCLICDEGSSKIIGYPSFYAIFEFDEQGSFVSMGVYE